MYSGIECTIKLGMYSPRQAQREASAEGGKCRGRQVQSKASAEYQEVFDVTVQLVPHRSLVDHILEEHRVVDVDTGVFHLVCCASQLVPPLLDL
jgi:hypothetical protein